MKDDGAGDRQQGPAPLTFGEIGRSIWHSLKQMKTVVYLLGLIAGLGWLGAVIPQNEDASVYTQHYGALLGGLVVRTGMDHLYHTTWFVLLLGILILSLAACSRRMWEQSRLRGHIPDAETASRRAKAAKGLVEGSVKLTADGAADALRTAAAKRGYRLRRVGEAGGKQWGYMSKHRWAAWGPAMAHYAVFLIALGALMGTIPGLSVDQTVQINEGQTYQDPQGLLPFSLKLHSFHIALNPGTDAIKNYYSDVSLLVKGQQEQRKSISVNHPLRYGSYYISQSSWGLSDAKVEVTQGGKTETLSFPLQQGCPGQGQTGGWSVSQQDMVQYFDSQQAALVAMGFYSDAERQGGQVESTGVDLPGHPAINLTVVSGFKSGGHSMKKLGWLMVGDTAPIKGGTVKFVGATAYTGLGVRKDLGVPLVWGGFIGCALGLMMLFYFPLRSAVVSLRPAGRGATVLSIAYSVRSGELAKEAEALWAGVLADLSAKRSPKALLREEIPDV